MNAANKRLEMDAAKNHAAPLIRNVMWKIMNKKAYFLFVDIAGKIMLSWFVFETFRYFYGGRFTQQLHDIPKMFNNDEILWLIYSLFQIPVAALGIFLLIPLLLKGHVGGLILGLLHWVLGYLTNPLWFIVPHELQVGPDGKATVVLEIINWTYSVITLVILVAFYYYRRSLKIKGAHNESLQPTAFSGG